MTYDTKTFTWGLELEFGDVPRSLSPPYSVWSLSETDIVNRLPPYYGIAADPAGINPPVGGELNTLPTNTIDKQVDVVSAILDYFNSNNATPTTSCVSQTHVHVHIPGLQHNVVDILKLLIFIYSTQDKVLSYANGFEPLSNMSQFAIEFFTEDNGRRYPPSLIRKMISSRELYDKRIDKLYNDLVIDREFAAKHRFHLKRYFVNFLPLREHDTIEFRCFRGTTDLNHIRNILLFCEHFLDCAFNNKELRFDYDLPKLNYEHDLFIGWEQTKYPAGYINTIASEEQKEFMRTSKKSKMIAI